MKDEFVCYHYDIARGAYLKPEYFKEALRLASSSGFTHFVPYLENMIRLSPIEKACPSCAYTAKDWQEFDQVAADAGIELLPHFNVIGHTAQICRAYPELVGHNETEMNVLSERSRRVIRSCLEEYCSFSKGTYFLIGGDEWQAPNHILKDPKTSAGKAWVSQINMAVECLVDRNRKPIVWHDMLLHYPDTLGLLSRDAIVAFWFYDVDSDHPALSLFKEYGFQTIMASGITSGILSRRRVNAISCAHAAYKKHAADGFMVTSWEDGRWEKQKLNIPLVGDLLAGRKVPQSVIGGISIIDMKRSVQNTEAARTFDEKLRLLLEDPAWRNFPEYYQYAQAVMKGDRQKELDSYCRYHHEEGPLYESIKHPKKDSVQASTSICIKEEAPLFGLVVSEDQKRGKAFRICNGDESFVVYPKYGASLQGWQKRDETIIAHSLPAFIERNTFAPGGYRSYSGVGGFRPIWAYGSHHSPCILWQDAFEAKIIEQSNEKISVEFSRSMQHVDVTYRITAQKGLSGFVYELEAANKMDICRATFCFNFPLNIGLDDLAKTVISWDGEQNKRALIDTQTPESFFSIPCRKNITVRTGRYAASITTEPEKTAGCYIDFSSSYITPDIRGKYENLPQGEIYRTRWVITSLSG